VFSYLATADRATKLALSESAVQARVTRTKPAPPTLVVPADHHRGRGLDHDDSQIQDDFGPPLHPVRHAYQE
jgi:hypothetical protein